MATSLSESAHMPACSKILPVMPLKTDGDHGRVQDQEIRSEVTCLISSVELVENLLDGVFGKEPLDAGDFMVNIG